MRPIFSGHARTYWDISGRLPGVWRHSLTLVINLNWTGLDLRIPTREGVNGSAGIPNRRV